MTVGGVDPSVLGPLPPTVQVQPWFPQLAVLRQAGAFITHAGMNPTMEALYYGVPMLALPQMPEPRAVTADTLRSALADVTSDPTIRANVARMQAEVRAAGGVEAGVRAIEDHLAAGPVQATPDGSTRRIS